MPYPLAKDLVFVATNMGLRSHHRQGTLAHDAGMWLVGKEWQWQTVECHTDYEVVVAIVEKGEQQITSDAQYI